MAIDKDLNVQLITAALAAAQGRSVSDALTQAGQMPDRMRMREANLSLAEARAEAVQLSNLKDQVELQKALNAGDIPERTYTLQEQNQDLLVAEAFGLYDALETGVADVGSFFGLAPAGGYTSQIANAAKKQINFDIKATAADAWRGKPNNFLLQQIIELIPSSYANGDAKAAARYGVIRNNFESRLSELDGQIARAKTGSASQANLIKTRANVKHMVNRLEVINQGFKGVTPDDDALTATSFYGVPGVQIGVDLTGDEAGLEAMEVAYRQFLEE